MAGELVSAFATHLADAQRKRDMHERKPTHRMVMFRARVSAKVKTLKAEGKPQNVAVATALAMARAGRLGPKGGYQRKGG